LNNETYIAFLRVKEKIDESLVTLEIKDNKIVQAKGSYNRGLSDEEKVFVEVFCKEKSLGVEL
jgi:hypothetical protein